jgi:glycosyltransferase involved in cell wall biosynthesis
MNILYHLTVLPPKIPEAEALSQEISALRRRFKGELVYLNPNSHSPIYLPRLLFGLHKLRVLWSREREVQLHHLYNPDPFPFPILRFLRRPVIYTITSGVGERLKPGFFNGLAAVAVADERSLKRLEANRVKNGVLVRPGIDTSRFTCSLLPLRSEIRLMVASAPWTLAQFQTKGMDALLAAARQNPQLHLVFLWRGVLAEAMTERVRRLNLAKQVTIIDELVDVNRVLAGVHASITLATKPGLIKSYPHSLLDSLAAGKPVLVSRAIPMADYVQETGCGQVVEKVTPADILAAVDVLARDYDDRAHAARAVGQRDFSQEAMITSYQKVYEAVLAAERVAVV